MRLAGVPRERSRCQTCLLVGCGDGIALGGRWGGGGDCDLFQCVRCDLLGWLCLTLASKFLSFGPCHYDGLGSLPV